MEVYLKENINIKSTKNSILELNNAHGLKDLTQMSKMESLRDTAEFSLHVLLLTYSLFFDGRIQQIW